MSDKHLVGSYLLGRTILRLELEGAWVMPEGCLSRRLCPSYLNLTLIGRLRSRTNGLRLISKS